MTDRKGPVYEGNVEEFAITEGGRTYRICYLPDKNNEQLQKEGKSPHFYWLPAEIRLAQDHRGHYKFSLMKYQGELSEDTHSGVEGQESIAGGVLSLTTTAKPPDGILKQAHENLKEKYRDDDDKYWGIRSGGEPEIGIAPVAENQTSISNISPNSEGTVPAMDGGGEGEDRSTATGRASDERASESATDGGTDQRERPPSGGGSAGGARPGTAPEPPSGPAGPSVTGPPVPQRSLVRDAGPVDADRSVAAERSGVDMWHERMEGGGAGSLDPAGENAFVGQLGSIPAAILWEGFQGQYSPVAVTQYMRVPVWSEAVHLKIEGDWERIQDHFSAHAEGGAFWAKADIKYQMDKLIQNGTIDVELSIDGTTPSGEKHAEAVQKRTDMIVEKFQEQAKDVIFEPAEDVKAAEAPDSGAGIFSPYSAGFALKKKKDITKVNLSYEETINERYLLDHVISSSLEGFYDEIQDDPAAEDRYFKKLFLDDTFRVVQRVVRPVANWGDRAEGRAGDPIEFMSAQVGYPDTNGDLIWEPQVYDTGDEEPKKIKFSRKAEDEVENPPEGWSPDKAFLKRRVHFKEPPGPTEYPYTTVQIEREIAELDGGERGTLSSDISHEVRADNAGQLFAGPMFLNVELENEKQYIEVAFKADGEKLDGGERGWMRMAWRYEDQDEPRFWNLFTGDPEYVPSFTYQVRVVVKGTIFSSGQEWLGPERTVQGNGPVKISVPTPDEAVETRSLTSREAAGVDPVRSMLEEPSDRMAAVEVRSGADDSADYRPPAGRKTMSEHVGEDAAADTVKSGDGGARSTDDRDRDDAAIGFNNVAGWTVE